MKKMILGMILLSSVSAFADEPIRSVECTIKKGFLNAGQKIEMLQMDRNDNRGMTIGGAEYLNLGNIFKDEVFVNKGMSNISGLYTVSYESKSLESVRATVIPDRSWGDTARDKKFNIKVIVSGAPASLLGTYHIYLEASCKRIQEGFFFKL